MAITCAAAAIAARAPVMDAGCSTSRRKVVSSSASAMVFQTSLRGGPAAGRADANARLNFICHDVASARGAFRTRRSTRATMQGKVIRRARIGHGEGNYEADERP